MVLVEVEESTIGGLPALLTESVGPLVGGLTFRVGIADETLPTHGISHLVEHLALVPIGQQPFPFNGMVDSLMTSFWAQGTCDEVGSFLTSVAHNIHHLELERLETEKRVLSTEAAQRKKDPRVAMLAERYGAQRFGLPWHEEFAFKTVSEDDVVEWAAKRFCMNSAALWIAGTESDLDAMRRIDFDLPHGEEHGAPNPIDYARTPGFLRAQGTVMAISRLTHLDEASFLGQRILERRLHQRLRLDEGRVYGLQTFEDRLDANGLHNIIWTDCLESERSQVLSGIHETFAALASDGPTTAERDEVVELAERAWSHPGAAPQLVTSAAQNVLLGRANRSRRDVLDEMSRTEPVAVADALTESMRTSLWLLPPGPDAPDGLETQAFWQVPRWTTNEFRRARVAAAADSSNALVVNPTGVAFVQDDEHAVHVPWDSCAAVVRFIDSRIIWGDDGLRVFVHPDEWSGGARAIEWVDQYAPPASFVDVPREAGSAYLDRLRQQREARPLTRGQAVAARLLSSGSTGWKPGGLGKVAAPLTAAFLTWFTTVATLAVAVNPGPNDSSAPLFITALISGALAIASSAWLVKKHRETQSR